MDAHKAREIAKQVGKVASKWAGRSSPAESDTVWNKAKGIVWQGSKTIILERLKYTLLSQ